jgi:hypothetical protein
MQAHSKFLIYKLDFHSDINLEKFSPSLSNNNNNCCGIAFYHICRLQVRDLKDLKIQFRDAMQVRVHWDSH